ncbi:LOW QUALITY PROTEIN: hypothetical protein PHMEG_00035194 [Phytophthora megakarya]|uniref:Reverse transcriptase/retrotransposon-derived protein RNase H-like domain-containing protein n=1 Tax=Phytophthora megakarya TaxID=4795 RepID=A0A225UNZ2_9STRA|nr:LOW QUALITY PROTEIN: hypothetical protein PHMEG_00035194 [Phytophthora megakarya]
MQQFLGSLNYYSHFIQDFAVYGAALYQLMEDDFLDGSNLAAAKESFSALQPDAPILRHFDAKKEVHIMLYANEWALNVRRQIHPVRFCGRVLNDAEMKYHSAEKKVLALLLLLKVCYTQLAGKPLHVYTRFSTLGWVHKSKSLIGRAVQFAVLLSPWQLEVQRLLMDSMETSRVADSDRYLEQTTVNMAEHSGMNHGVIPALEHGAEDLVIVGDSRLAIHQSLGVIACRKDSLMTLLNHHRELVAKLKSARYLDVVREYNAAADSLTGEALESKVSKWCSTTTVRLSSRC